jgi:FkbM family methyltransferase
LNIFRGLLHPKPEFIFRPKQIMIRIVRGLNSKPRGLKIVNLPWGLKIGIDTKEIIGGNIWNLGVYDLALCETLWRLAKPGELCVDVGSNIGQMLSILGLAVGAKGRVIGFEPQPDLFAELQTNMGMWSVESRVANISVFQIALYNEEGIGRLAMPSDFALNRGTARLVSDEDKFDYESTCVVKQKRLDQMVTDPIGVLKIDVEGQELKVLSGAGRLLKEGKIREIIFETHEVYPTIVTEFLEGTGYEIFEINKTFWGPQIRKPRCYRFRESWEGFNYLATLSPYEAQEKLRKRGWQCLKGLSF